MPGGIFLVGDNEELVEMTEAPYDSEDILQELLAKYPNLLAGDQIDSEEPRRWLLVTREMGLPSDKLEGNRWSVDHLFLDQDGIPTLVEVKRSQNTQIRREVVGQLLEYAANAVSYWPVERIISELERRCERENLDAQAELDGFLGPDTESDDYWNRVRTNLQAGRLRLVFVADAIPKELRRIVEFLNEQMNPADVFALEVRQFSGEGMRTLVPRLIGTNERKGIQRVSRERSRWDEDRFLNTLEKTTGPEAVEAARAILKWSRSKGLRDWWGAGGQVGSFIPVLDANDKTYSILSMWTSGSVEILFQYFTNWEPFTSRAKRLTLAEKLNEIPGITIPLDAIERRPPLRLADIHQSKNVAKLLNVFDWVLEEFRNA